jgi:flagellar protein FliT
MANPLQQLEDTRLAMVTAVTSEDWGRIAELDCLCREHVTQAMLSSDTDQQALRVTFEKLLELYAQMLESCQHRRDQLGSELVQLNQAQQGAKVYQLFG